MMKSWTVGIGLALVLLGTVGGLGEFSEGVQAQTVEERQAEADRLFEGGRQQYQNSQFREAAQSWEKALEIYRAIENLAGEGDSLNNLGVVYRLLGEYRKAIEYYEQSLAIARELDDRNGEGRAFNNLGNVYRLLGEYRKAIEYYEQSLAIARELDDRSGEENSYNNLGLAYRSLGHYNKAIDYHEQSLAISRELSNRWGMARAFNNLGLVYEALGKYRKAIEYHEQSLAIARELGDPQGVGYSLGNLGGIYELLGEYSRAIEYYQQSLTIVREIGDRSGERKSLNNLGLVYEALGEYSKAIEYYQQSLTIAREIGDRSGEGKSLNNLGSVSSLLGEYSKAIEYHQQSLTIAREIGDRSGEGKSLNNLGFVYEALGEYAKAIDYHQQSLAIDREINNPSGEGKSLNNLGNVYRSLGEYKRAIDYFQQSLAIFQAIGSRVGESSALGNLGNISDLLGEYTNAIDYYQQSLAIFQKIGSRAGESSALGALGNVYHSLEEDRRAIDYYQQSLTLKREIGDRAGEGIVLGNLGIIYDSQGQYERAIAYHQRSLIIAQKIGDRSGEGISRQNLALVKYQQGNFAEALKDIEASIAIAESIRTEVDNPDLRQSFFATVSNRYQLYIDILMQLHRENPHRGYNKQAFQASEKNRARTLTEILTEANLNIRQNVDPQLLQEEQHQIRELSNLEKRRLELTSSSYANEDLERLIRDRDALLKQLSDLETRIRRENSAYADLKYPQPLTLAEIQRDILDDDTLLLEYALGSERSYLFVVGKNEFAVYKLPPRQEIERAAEKYAIALQAEDRNPLAEGKAIAHMLLNPIADRLKGQRLAIVADGKLHRLPFGALPWGAGGASGAGIAPLLANHEIVNFSSASSLAIQRKQTENRPPAAQKIAVFADPVFSKRDPRLSGEVATSPDNSLLELFRDGCQSFDRLPHTRTEAENILSLIPDNQEFLAMGFAADRATATRAELAQYQILHLSTHGCIQDNPQLSGLALSLYDKNGKQKDGFLRLQDIYNLQLNADLVVLSACQTGIGEEVSGEGVVGLTRGFLYAGATRVTVSLWNVSDIATANLMSDYYQNMINEEMKPATALREAQLQMWREGEYPYKWAAFIMQGDWK
ncbi:MAG: tetratricopeptide repeat protein [Cyanobacteria bacterium SBLK]|nr:tetratricopeptide repeat protein [Cyanobacteria bacterium SBLK]